MSPSSLPPPASFVGILGHAPPPPAPAPEHSPDSYRGQEGRPAAVAPPASLCLTRARGREFVPRTAVCHSFKAAFRLSSKGIRRRCLKQTGRAVEPFKSGGVHAFLLLVGSHFISPIQKRLLRRGGFSRRRRRLFHIASFRAVTIARPSERASLPSSIMALRQIECRRRRLGGTRDAAGRQTFC